MTIELRSRWVDNVVGKGRGLVHALVVGGRDHPILMLVEFKTDGEFDLMPMGGITGDGAFVTCRAEAVEAR